MLRQFSPGTIPLRSIPLCSIPLRTIPRPTFGPLAAHRSRAVARRVAPVVLDRLAAGVGAGRWRLGESVAGRGGTCVFAVRDDDDPAAAGPVLLKAAGTPQGRAELERQVEVLAALHADERLGPWARLLPRTLDAADVDGVYVVLESRLPGADARGAPVDRVVPAALAAVGELAERTGGVAPLDDATVGRWVHEPAARVRAVVRGGHRATLDRVEAELVAALAGREVARAWTHGDYNRTNVLFVDGQVSGVVDWPDGEPDGLVGADAVTLLLFEAVIAGRGHDAELGPVLLRTLGAPVVAEAAVAAARAPVGGEELPIRVMLLLSWLRHVGGNLTGSTRYAANPVWMHRNVRTVLAGLSS